VISTSFVKHDLINFGQRTTRVPDRPDGEAAAKFPGKKFQNKNLYILHDLQSVH